jgi:hypothetical protein
MTMTSAGKRKPAKAERKRGLGGGISCQQSHGSDTTTANATVPGDKRSVTEIEADEVGASLRWATAKVERASQRGNGDRTQGRERQAERGGDSNDAPPF